MTLYKQRGQGRVAGRGKQKNANTLSGIHPKGIGIPKVSYTINTTGNIEKRLPQTSYRLQRTWTLYEGREFEKLVYCDYRCRAETFTK